MSNSDFCNENFTVYRWTNNFFSLFFNLKKGYFGSYAKVQFITVRKSRWRELEAAGHMTSITRKKTVMTTYVHLGFSVKNLYLNLHFLILFI